MYKRIIYILCALLICLSSINTVLADDDDGMDNYKIVDVYVANEKETEYGEIQFVQDSKVYPDLSEGDTRIVNILSALGIAKAFGDEEMFRPDESIKRSEFVSLAMSLINADAGIENDRICFSDISEDNIYFDDIKAAASLGIINGYEDGRFYPDNDILYDEAISILTKSLGYSVAAEIKGGWSLGYTAIADRIGLTYGIKFGKNESLSRVESLRLLYNALDCPVLYEKSIGYEIEYVSEPGKNALTEYHDIYNTEGRLNATFVSALPGYTETDNTTIIVGDEMYTVKKNDYVEYLGYDVEIYFKDNKKNKEIVFLAPKEGIKKTVIKADDITKFENLTYYYENGKKAHVAPAHSLIVNGVRLDNYTENNFVPENGDVVLISNKGTAYDTVIINTFHSFLLKSISTNRDEEIVFESQYNLPSFIIKSNDENQAFMMYLDERKIETYARVQTVYNADGFAINQIVIPDIPKDSVLNIFADKYDTIFGKVVPSRDAKFVKIVISTQRIQGKAASYNNEEILVDNDDGEHHCYKVSDENLLDNNKVSYKYDIIGYYLFDYDGKIFAFTIYDGEDQYIMADSGKKVLVNSKNLDIGLVYGYLINVKMSSSSLDKKLSAKILASDGSINIYPFADKVTFNGDKVTNHEEIASRLNSSAQILNPKFTISQLIKYELNKDKKIIGVETVLQNVGLPEGVAADHFRLEHEKAQFSSRSEFGWNLWLTEGKNSSLPLYNGEARQYFKVPTFESFEDEDYSVPGTWWPNNTSKTVEIFDCDEMLVPSVVVQYDNPNDEYTYPYVMVKNVTRGLDNYGNTVDILYFVGLAGDPIIDNPYTIKERSTKPGEEEDTLGGEARFFASEDGLFDGLKCGDLIKIYGSNRYISKWEMVMSLEDAKKFDISRYPMKVSDARQKWDMYEVYSVIEGDKQILMVQRGEEIGDGKREYMQLNPFEGVNGVILYDATGRHPEVTYWDNPHLLKQARKDGIENASRVYIWETNVVMKLLVGYIGL